MSFDSQLPAPSSRVIETEIGPPPEAATSVSRQTLPDDLLREAAHRLGFLSLVMAGLILANFLLAFLIFSFPGLLRADELATSARWLRVYEPLGAVAILVSLALYWYTRGSKRSPRFLLDLALGYEVFIALTIGVLDYAVEIPKGGVSWIAILILLFPAIIPSTPRKTLIAALLAASMDPVGALVVQAMGIRGVPELGRLLLMAAPSYLCAGVAALISHIITRLGREVRKAREMGSYVLGDLIGSGGMGEVWKATHRFLARPAAIKLIKPQVLGAVTDKQADMLVQRFRREARAAANLRSPHTIQLYDFGVASDGTFYYVMELLNGLDLQTLVSQHGALPPGRAIHILQQACESLAEAHERGLVHRDIKPANIQVCRMGHYHDFVKVLDFGLVKSQGVAGQIEPGLTAPNMVSGTPAYLSPESAMGHPVDQRSDIYALGCVAYWMLTARHVFKAPNAVQLLARHIQTTPEPPSKHSGYDLSPDLDAIVLACLAKRPSDRPSSARELADRLSRCEVESPWTREDARRWWATRSTPEPAIALHD